MSWSKEVGEHVGLGLEEVLKLPEGPRREVLVRALRSCSDLLARPIPDAEAVSRALRVAMAPAMVLASSEPDTRGIVATLAPAYNASLDPLRPRRLEAAPPPLLDDELTSVAGDAPRTVSIARAPFEPEEILDLDDVEAIDDEDTGEREDLEAPIEDPPPAERPPREDWRPAEGVAPEPPPVRLLDDRKTLARADFHAAVVEQCLEAITAFARDRSHDPLSIRPGAERKILAAVDAVLASGGACVATILAWWGRAIESPSPWSSWTASFVLGAIEGADALLAVRHGLEKLAPDAIGHGEQAAEALALIQHDQRATLGADLAASPHPVARAVGVDVLARAGRLPIEDLRQHLFDGNPPVVASALRVAARLPAADGAPLGPLLERWIHFPDAAVAEQAARALLRWGNSRPYDDLRQGGRLASIARARAVELFVLTASQHDLEPLQALVGRSARTASLFAALGRFGHPGVAPFLVHQLADEDLADPAAEALITIFGPDAAPEDASSGPAWKAAIAAQKPDPAVRYRRGEPWKPSGLAAECASGDLSRAQIEPRIDELAARARVEAPVDLGLWTPEVERALAALTSATSAASTTWPASGWP